MTVAEMYLFLSDDVIHLYDVVVSYYTTGASVVVTLRIRTRIKRILSINCLFLAHVTVQNQRKRIIITVIVKIRGGGADHKRMLLVMFMDNNILWHPDYAGVGLLPH